jgi:hypothetical protein
MIGRSEWFTIRKYGGWGIHPKTKEGWIYLFLIIIPFIVFHCMSVWSTTTRLIVSLIWVSFLLFDIFEIMINLKKDEREKMHEAISERNALWAIVFILTIGLIYHIIESGLRQELYIPPFIIIALVIGASVKTITNVYLEKHN